jgi:hypothetical protein
MGIDFKKSFNESGTEYNRLTNLVGLENAVFRRLPLMCKGPSTTYTDSGLTNGKKCSYVFLADNRILPA